MSLPWYRVTRERCAGASRPDGVTMQRPEFWNAEATTRASESSRLKDAPGPLMDMSRSSGVAEPLTIFRDLRV